MYFYSTDGDTPGLLKLALNKADKSIHGEVRLVVSIMESGILDMDEEYIEGFGLRNHCYMLQLDYHSVHAAFTSMSGLIKIKKEWR
tara:strand:+ start:449 stop:706 length:258 start_codon:yes stop_codon:yes gene_type:complete